MFGRASVAGEGLVVDSFTTRRSMLLLARVALSPRKEIARSEAADALWPEDFYDATRLRLRQELTRLRKALGPAADIVSTDTEWIRLDTSLLEIDTHEFEEAARLASKELDAGRREKHLRRVLEIGAAPLLEGGNEPWIMAERVRLRNVLYVCMVELSKLLHARLEDVEALAFAKKATHILPVHESAYLTAMEILVGQAKREEARGLFKGLQRAIQETGGRLSERAERAAKRILEPDRSEKSTSESPAIRFRTPHPAESIFGRETELTEIVERMRPVEGGARLATLLGPGGIGKTRLLLESAIRLKDDYEGRVSFVDLSEVDDIHLVSIAILGELRADVVPTEDPVGRLVEALPDAPVLLALDNLEQFGATARGFVRELLEARPGLRILSTSRAALNLACEYRLPIGPLQVPEEAASPEEAAQSPAMRFFLEAVGRNGHPVADKDLASVRSIVRRLEGVPLAIQLAAARLRTLAPGELEAQLQTNDDVLEVKRADVPARHQSIRNAVKGSFDSLEPDLRQTLAELSVFRGGWTLESARQVCGIDDPLTTMEALLDASLIYVAQEGRRMRFRMLEAIRTHARTRLDVDETLDLRRNHTEWVVRFCESVAREYMTSEELGLFDDVDTELDNVREALRFALDHDADMAFRLGASLAFFWRYRSNGFEAGRFYDELFSLYGDLPVTEASGKAAYGAALVVPLCARYDEMEVYEKARQLCSEAGLRSDEAKVTSLLAVGAQNRLLYADVDRLLAEAWLLLEGNEDRRDHAYVATMAGYCLCYQGRPEEALPMLREAVEEFSRAGESFYQCRARQLLGLAALELDRLDVARWALDGLLEIVVGARFLPMTTHTLGSVGRLALAEGRYEEAIRLFESSKTEWEARHIRYKIAEMRHWLGKVYVQQGDLDVAERYFRAAASLWLAAGTPVASGMAFAELAGILWARGEREDAARLFAVAEREVRSRGARVLRSEDMFLRCFRARIEEELGAIDPGTFSLEKAAMRYAAELMQETPVLEGKSSAPAR